MITKVKVKNIEKEIKEVKNGEIVYLTKIEIEPPASDDIKYATSLKIVESKIRRY